MKFSFSTVGCPDWSWHEIVATAKDLGYDGVEVRGIEGQIDLPKAREFSEAHLENTLSLLRRTELQVPCLASSCYLHVRGTDEARQAEGRAYIDLAARMGVPYVRLLGDTDPEPGVSLEVVPLVVRALASLADYAAKRNVTVLLETNGLFADSKLMLQTMQAVGGAGVGVLWDIHHPYRYFGESPETTWGRLQAHVRHIHAKDSRLHSGSVTYTLMGEGDIPVQAVFSLLTSSGYDGWVSLEWVKRWLPDLEEPGLVFPHFINFARKSIGNR